MQISVIIPTLNEENIIGSILNHLKSNSKQENIAEIIVIDSCSSDDTLKLAEENSAMTYLTEKKSRAAQMNIGAVLSTGDVLYFLHADSFPPKDFDTKIINSIRNEYNAGCFRMKWNNGNWLLAICAWFTRFSWNICRGGDQSLFMTKKLFNKIDGFNEQLIIMEDNEIIPRIKKNTKFKVIKSELVTSARKYGRNGVYKLQFIFALIHIFYRLGVSQERLLNFYNKNVC